MKARGRTKGERPRHRIKASEAAAFLVLGLLVVFVAYLLIPAQTPTSVSASSKAAIVDQLSINSPGGGFNKAADSIMGQAGLQVDIYEPEKVTVNLYGTLPAGGYRLIVFRVHAGVNQKLEGHPVGLYTTEPYNEFGYPQEQLTDLVAEGRAFNRSEATVFAVTPKFIRERSVTDYRDTIVVLMGCYGLFSRDLPQAFIDRGASVVIGWKELVSVRHTDEATLALLRKILLDKATIGDSVSTVMSEVGPDPDHDGVLSYCPHEKGSLTFSELVTKRFLQAASCNPLQFSTRWRLYGSSNR